MLKKTLPALLLCLALSMTTFAGDLNNPGYEEPPPQCAENCPESPTQATVFVEPESGLVLMLFNGVWLVTSLL